jgi:very-short-patch-repair endonuclease
VRARREELSPRQQWARAEAAAQRRVLEDLFAQQLHAHGLPRAEREVHFHPTRAWRFDFAWPELRVAVEVDGGTWGGGRHVRGKGFQNDADKLNAAQVLGWKVFRYTSTRIRSCFAVAEIRVALERAAWGRRDPV